MYYKIEGRGWVGGVGGREQKFIKVVYFKMWLKNTEIYQNTSILTISMPILICKFMCVSVFLRRRPSATAGPWVRNHIRHSRFPASSVVCQSYVGSLSMSVTSLSLVELYYIVTPLPKVPGSIGLGAFPKVAKQQALTAEILLS